MTATVNRRAMSVHGIEVLPTRGRGGVAASTAIKRGWHVARNSGGYIVPFTAALNLISAGLAEEDVDNTLGADGDLETDTLYGIVDQLIGTSGDALANTDAPCVCYAMDNQTVGKSSGGGTRSIAGIFTGINSETTQARVFVGPMAYFFAQGFASAAAAEPAATITTGTATLASGTVTVSTTAVTSTSKILVARKSKAASTAIGELATPTRTVGTSFVIVAQNPTDGTTQTNDVSTVDWTVIG